MSREIANKYHAYLLHSIHDASRSLELFVLLRSRKFTTGTTKKDNWLEEILLSSIILKIHTIFDRSGSAVCLEKFLNNEAKYIADSTNIKEITKRFGAIKNDHSTFIKQIENNRHEEVAHIPREIKLGVTEEVAQKIRNLGQLTGNKDYINQKSVDDEEVRFSVGNFPTTVAKDLIDKLSKLIFAILYPRTIDKNEN